MAQAGMHSAELDVEPAAPSGDAPADREAAAADPARFRHFFDVHFAWVWRTLRRLGVPERALPDASQRVFWTASRRLETIAESDERAFLFGTVRRVAADFRRLSEHVVRPDAESDLADVTMPSPEELLDQKRARELLDRMLESMTMELREVLILQEGEGMSLAEIAATLRIPHGTAASRLRRARQQFRLALKRWLSQSNAKGSP
jgi:RNA polymerase sigma-70 factor (ECF subfamily)